MKRRWRLLTGAGIVAALIVLVPVGYVEGTCRAPVARAPAAPPPPLLAPGERRPLARTYLTYPEWHIVFEAEAFARYLSAGGRPSGFRYDRQIAGFWSSYCAVNRLTRGSPAAREAKVMIYTIGISYSVELGVKAVYERTIGWIAERLGGWHSTDDAWAATVQAAYGHFMHETPWYRFPFGAALAGTWRTRSAGHPLRHAERRVALSAEYGVKALYARAIDAATGATLGRDAPTLRLVARASPATIRGVDPRLRPLRALPGGLTVVEAPRYQQFNDLLARLAAARVPLVEIAGNTTIMATVLLPDGTPPPAAPLFAMPVDDRRRVAVAIPVGDLPALYARTRAAGGIVEHVYDY